MRQLFQFSIRDVLWLTLVAAVVLSWWIDRQNHFTLTERVLGPGVGTGPSAKPYYIMGPGPWNNIPLEDSQTIPP